MEKHPYEDYYRKLMPVLVSKVEEFRLVDYGTADVQTLWEYLLKKKWKKPDEEQFLSRLVADILSVKPGEYMNYTQVTAYKSAEWGTKLSDEDMDFLFEPPKGRE